MPYTPVTKVPLMKYFQWSTPTYPNPRLASPIVSTDTTIYVTAPPLDESGTIVANDFLMGIKNNAGYVETVYVPASGISVDGKTFTGVTRGVRLTGLDPFTGDASLAADFDTDSPIFCNISAINFSYMLAALQGGVASGGTTWKIGDETDQDIIIYAQNADANKPAWNYNKTANAWEDSNDGVTFQPFGTGSGLTASKGVKIVAGDIEIDKADTTTITSTSAGVGDADKLVKTKANGYLDYTLGGMSSMGASFIYGADGGGSDAYAVTLTNAPTSYIAGMVVNFKANTINTGAATLNCNSLGAKTIKKNYNADLEDGDIQPNQIVTVIYDGTNFQMLSPAFSPNVYIGTGTLSPARNSTSDVTITHSTGKKAKTVEVYFYLPFGSYASTSPSTHGIYNNSGYCGASLALSGSGANTRTTSVQTSSLFNYSYDNSDTATDAYTIATTVNSTTTSAVVVRATHTGESSSSTIAIPIVVKLTF